MKLNRLFLKLWSLAPIAILASTSSFAAARAPSGLWLSPDSQTQLTAYWDYDGSGNVTGYSLAFGGGQAAPDCKQGVRLSADTTSYARNNLAAGSTYTVSLCSIDRRGNFSQSVSATETTWDSQARVPAPRNLMISSDSQTQLTARWTSGGRNTTGFYIAYSASNTPAKCSGGLDIGNVTSYTRSDLDPDKAFFITVCAHDSQGNLSDGISAQQRTQPSDRFVPSASGLQIVSNSPQSLTMTWRSGGRNTAGFAVSFSATPTPAACGGVKIGNQLTYTRSDFDPNTTYSVTICAYDAQGNFSQPISMQGRTQPNNVFIPSPTNVLVEPIGRGGLVITWAPPFQYNPAGYSITFAPGANPPKCSGIKLGKVFSYTRTDLAPNTQYSVSICAYDERGNVSQPAGGTQITD